MTRAPYPPREASETSARRSGSPGTSPSPPRPATLNSPPVFRSTSARSSPYPHDANARDGAHHGRREGLRRKPLPPTPTRPSPAYDIPPPPAPPTLTITPYDSERDAIATDPWESHHLQPAHRPHRNRSLLSRLGSLGSSLTSPRQSQYGALGDDGPEDEERGVGARRAITEVDEYEVGVDISALEGPFALQNLGAKGSPKMGATVTVAERRDSGGSSSSDGTGRDDVAARDPLHWQRSRTSQATLLGVGMQGVKEAALAKEAAEQARSRSTPGRHTSKLGPSKSTLGRIGTVIGRRKSAVPDEAREREALLHEQAQKAAEKSGDIVAITEEIPAVDISSFGGSQYQSRNVLNTLGDGKLMEVQRSYYFPEDPDMPSWRPFSMHWAYILFLTLTALFLAGLQEFLCQYSLRKEAEGSGILAFHKPQELSTADYFAWKYAPTMVLVTYGVLWQISDYEVKRLEPYYQLSKRTGATAAESLNMDYITFFSYFTPMKAVRYRQWAVVVSSIGYLAASGLVPVLQSASVFMAPDMDDRVYDKLKFVRINAAWSRSLTVALVCVALCGITLLFQLRRKSGLLSDPKGIAGIAAMATRSHILQDFHGLDRAPHHTIHKQLRHRRYILHKSSLWQGEFIRANDNRRDTDVDAPQMENPQPLMLTLKAGVPFIVGMLLFAILIPVFAFTNAMAATERLPWLMTALATCIKLVWSSLDGDVRMMEPFFVLSRRDAPPRTLTLDYTGTIPGWLCVRALLNRHFLVAAVGLGAILTEVLTVCVSSFGVDGSTFFPGSNHPTAPSNAGPAAPGSSSATTPEDSRYNSDETFKSFWVSFGLAVSSLLILCGTAAAVYVRRRHSFLPRQPGTIASVLGFIHQSKMLAGFVDTEKLTSRQMTQELERQGHTYGLGWFKGRDGKHHCGIDQDDVEEYRHGEDPTRGRLLMPGTWDHYEG